MKVPQTKQATPQDLQKPTLLELHLRSPQVKTKDLQKPTLLELHLRSPQVKMKDLPTTPHQSLPVSQTLWDPQLYSALLRQYYFLHPHEI